MSSKPQLVYVIQSERHGFCSVFRRIVDRMLLADTDGCDFFVNDDLMARTHHSTHQRGTRAEFAVEQCG